jgi:peroxiredoxin
MGKKNHYFFRRSGLAFAILLLIPVSAFGARIKDPAPVLRSGDLFPSISLLNSLNAAERSYLGIERKRTFLPEDIKCEIVVFKFLNTNCVYCIKLLPTFNEVYQLIEQDPILRTKARIMGISAGDTLAEVEGLKKHHPVSYPVIADTDFKAHKAVGGPRVPFIVVARKDKKNQWVVATVNVGLIFSAEHFIGELKAILHTDPETLK